MFAMLRRLADASSPESAADLAEALDLPMTTALRVLATLETAGYAERHQGTPRYVIGKAARTLAFAFMSQFPIRDLALPYLQRLTLESGQTASLFVRLGSYAVRAATVLGEGVPSQRLMVGEHRTLLEGAPSLVIFANLPAAEVAEATVQRSASELGEAAEAVKQIREDGSLILACFFEPTAFDFAVPLFDSRKRVIGSVAIESLPASLADEIGDQKGTIREIVRELAQSAGEDATLTSHYDHVPSSEIEL